MYAASPGQDKAKAPGIPKILGFAGCGVCVIVGL